MNKKALYAIWIIIGVISLWEVNALYNIYKPKTSVLASIQNTNTIVGVNDFATNPDNYLGKNIELKGVVSFVYPESQTIVMIDNAEYASCGKVTCAINQTPVSYSGTMPQVKDYIIASGTLAKNSDGKLIFNASSIKPQ